MIFLPNSRKVNIPEMSETVNESMTEFQNYKLNFNFISS